MKIGPKYKIAKRLGSAVFEKTQTAKYAVRAEKKSVSLTGARGKSNFSNQLLEKQKVRFTYAINAKQLKNYVREIIRTKAKSPEAKLFEVLEQRLDNVMLRSGFASTRLAARQMVTHGHTCVNGKKTTVPSYKVKKGDVVTIKESSKTKPIFINIKEKLKESNSPAWLKVNLDDLTITILDLPQYKPIEVPINLNDVIQFYKR